MIITCEACNVRFNLDENLLKPTGSKVRCSKCRHVFKAYPAEPPQAAPVVPEPLIAPVVSPAAEEPETPVAAQTLEMPLTPTPRDLGVEFKKTSELDLTDLSRMISETDAPAQESQDRQPPADSAETPASLDLDLGQTEAQEDLDAQIDDLNLDFDLDEATQKELAADLDSMGDAKAAEGIEEIQLDLDTKALENIDDLDLDLDFDAGPMATETAANATGAKADDLLLDLDLAETPAAGKGAAAAEPEDLKLDLDLGGDQELSLDLDLAETPAAGKGAAAAEPEDLKLDLDLETAGEAPTTEKDEELDLSDLDTLLDEDVVPAKAAESGELELSLDLDLGPVEEKAEKAGVDVSDDLDLTDLLLEGGKPTEKGGAEEELLLDLDLDGEGPPPDRPAPAVKAGDDLDLSDLETLLDDGKAAAPVATDTQELELDLDLGDTAEPDQDAEQTLLLDEEPPLAVETAKAPADEEQTLVMDADEIADSLREASTADYAATMEMTRPDFEALQAGPQAEEQIPVEKAAKPKKRLGTPVLVAALVVILLGGGFSALVALNRMGITIPFVSGFFAPEVADSGNLNITALSINSRFVADHPAGRLFVISGKVRNDYPDPRSFIRVTGKIFSQGKKLAQTLTVPCGNVLNDQELASLGLDEIKARLNIPAGDKKTNINVAPGGSVPFMVVFADLPEDLEEFTLEVASSVAAGN